MNQMENFEQYAELFKEIIIYELESRNNQEVFVDGETLNRICNNNNELFTNYFENTNMLNLLGAQGILKIHTFDNNIRFYSLPNKNTPNNPPCINDFNLI
tara:strand:+ start:1041 stop:1340 length:300 start_codon:yes stop_codon:yes gene_type:complete